MAWLYRKLIRYRYNDEHNLMPYLEKEFYKVFGDVYEKALEKNYIERIIQAACKYDSLYGNMPIDGSLPFEYSIGTYYDSWRLRGDDPELYSMGYYKRNVSGSDLWRRYGVNEERDGEGNLLQVRYSLSAVILNHFYHYNSNVKTLGNSSVQVKIPEHMVDTIEFVQKQMQREIARREIAIETNPTWIFVQSFVLSKAISSNMDFVYAGVAVLSGILLQWIEVKKYQETWIRHARHKFVLDNEMFKFISEIDEYESLDRKKIFRDKIRCTWEENNSLFLKNMKNETKIKGVSESVKEAKEVFKNSF